MPPLQNNDSSEDFGKLPQGSESFRNIPNASEVKSSEQPTNHQNEKTNLSPDLMQEHEELRIDKRVLEREVKFKDEWIKKIEGYVPQLVEQSRTIGYLESKNESLEEEKQRLLSA